MSALQQSFLRAGLLTTSLLLSACLYPEVPVRRFDASVDDAQDAAMRADTGSNPMLPLPSIEGCTPAMFADRRGMSAERVVTFGLRFNPARPNAYSPPCMLVERGQEVVFRGTFLEHPLTPVSDSTRDAGAMNPIPGTFAGEEIRVRFPDVGDFGFFCEIHGGVEAMRGVIAVR